MRMCVGGGGGCCSVLRSVTAAVLLLGYLGLFGVVGQSAPLAAGSCLWCLPHTTHANHPHTHCPPLMLPARTQVLLPFHRVIMAMQSDRALLCDVVRAFVFLARQIEEAAAALPQTPEAAEYKIHMAVAFNARAKSMLGHGFELGSDGTPEGPNDGDISRLALFLHPAYRKAVALGDEEQWKMLRRTVRATRASCVRVAAAAGGCCCCVGRRRWARALPAMS